MNSNMRRHGEFKSNFRFKEKTPRLLSRMTVEALITLSSRRAMASALPLYESARN